MKKGVMASTCIIIGLIIIVVSFFGPWYTSHAKYSFGGSAPFEGFGSNFSYETDYNQNFYLTKMEIHGTMMGQQMTQSISYDYMKKQMQASSQTMNMGIYDIFGNTMYIVIGALITSVLALIGILGVALNFGKSDTMRKIGIIFGIVTFILAISAIGYFWMGWNNQMQESISSSYSSSGTYDAPDITLGFWYNYNQDGNEMSMGPGFAWYLMIIAGIITLISTFLILKKEVQPAPEFISNLEPPPEIPNQ